MALLSLQIVVFLQNCWNFFGGEFFREYVAPPFIFFGGIHDEDMEIYHLRFVIHNPSHSLEQRMTLAVKFQSHEEGLDLTCSLP